jgi:glycosyltransferase involved in cell wall biosynthesis
MKISILVPVYNEEETINKIIDVLENLPLDKEIIIIDDGSTDRTREILTESIKNSQTIKVIFHEVNRGKGKAIRTGIDNMTGDVMCIQDADLEYDPNEISDLLKGFDDPEIAAVYGSRFLKHNPNIYKRYLLGNKVLTGLINFFYGSNYTDSYTCYKLIKSEILKELDLKSSGFEMEAEISIKLTKMKCKVKEIPINYTPRTIEKGKKIGWIDALKGVITILKYLKS